MWVPGNKTPVYMIYRTKSQLTEKMWWNLTSTDHGGGSEILTTPENCGGSENLASDCSRPCTHVNVSIEELTSDARCDVCSIRSSSLVREGPIVSGANVTSGPTSSSRNLTVVSHVPKYNTAAKALITSVSCGDITNVLWNTNNASLQKNTKCHGCGRQKRSYWLRCYLVTT